MYYNAYNYWSFRPWKWLGVATETYVFLGEDLKEQHEVYQPVFQSGYEEVFGRSSLSTNTRYIALRSQISDEADW